MELLTQFINEYGTTLLYALVTAIAGCLGTLIGVLYKKWINAKTEKEVAEIKKAIAKSVVQFVEQVYKDIHGQEKLNEAMKAFSEMLSEKGITITELEMKVLLEAAVAEFNQAFNKKDESAIED